MDEIKEELLFIERCLKLDTLIRNCFVCDVPDPGFTNGQICAVLSRILAEIFIVQENPNKSMEEYIKTITQQMNYLDI